MMKKQTTPIISSEELEQMLSYRDAGMKRIEDATEIRKRQLAAKTDEEYDAIPIPQIFPFNQNPEIKGTILDDPIIKNILMDRYCRGFTIEDNGFIVSRYGELGLVPVSTLYRGEIKDYETSCTSNLGRYIREKNEKIEDRIVDFFIGQMKIHTFYGFLTKFRQFREFPVGSPMPHIIAQHYGLQTQFLDLTDDIKIALFFACCKHMGNNKYRPINDDDLGELRKYAVLYQGVEELKRTQMIGYQPFPRCQRQRGYYLDTAAEQLCWEFSLTEMKNFKKFYIKRTPELSKWIFEEFNGGEVLFPKDTLYYYEKEIEQINKMDKYPEEVFEIMIDCLSSYLASYAARGLMEKELYQRLDKDWLKDKLNERDIKLVDKIVIKQENGNDIEKINRNWDLQKYLQDEDILAWGRAFADGEKDGDFYIAKRPGLYML